MQRSPRAGSPAPKTTPTIDPDALQQRIADLEALMSTPGWAALGDIANRFYGLRAFADQVDALTKLPTVEQVGMQVYALTASRQTALHLLGLPTHLIEEYKRKLATQQDGEEPAEPPPFGPDVE